MDEDTLVILAVVLGLGVVAWLLLGRKAVAPPPPCNVNVAYQGVGVGIPCGAIKDVGEAVADVAVGSARNVGNVFTNNPLSGALGLGGDVDPNARKPCGAKITTFGNTVVDAATGFPCKPATATLTATRKPDTGLKIIPGSTSTWRAKV